MEDLALNKLVVARYVIVYAVSFLALALVVYYLPDYSLLEAMIAEHSAGVLNAIGIPAESAVVGTGVYVNHVEIVRECTGIQVIAVFAGLLLPLPKVSWQVKFKAVAVLGFSVYLANVMRVALELWLLYAGILPWSMAHGPVGTILGVVTVFIFFLVSDRFIPQIGEFLGRLVDWIIENFNRTSQTRQNAHEMSYSVL